MGSYKLNTNYLLIKKVDHRAWTPMRAFPDDAGLDLFAIEDTKIPADSFQNVRTGLAVKIADGFWGMIRPRSSTFFKRNLVVHEGTIDPGYTGELNIGVYNPSKEDVIVLAGDRIAQLVIIALEIHKIEIVDYLPDTSRGPAGFGSSGR